MRGSNFIALHGLFDTCADEAESYSDLIAERARSLGGQAEGTVQRATQFSCLLAYPLGVADQQQPVFAVSGALAAFGESAREAINRAAGFGDADTADLFTEISRNVDQQLWLVESHGATQ